MGMQMMSGRRVISWVMIALLGAVTLIGGGCVAMTPEQENSLGEQQAPKFLAEGGGRVPDAAVQQYVTNLGQKLVGTTKPNEQTGAKWEFFVLNSSVINAFALPGGKVFISRGLMERLSNEAEVAAVLGHETGHVLSRHIAKQMGQQGIVETGLGVIQSGLKVVGVSDTTAQVTTLLGSAGSQLYLLRFSRTQESEADRYGLDLMTRAGYSPQGMVGVLTVLQKQSAGGGAMEMLSTHPDPANRLIQARDLINTQYKAANADPQHKLDPEDYKPILQRLRQLPPPADAKKPG